MVNHLVLQGRLVEEPRFGDTSANTRYANFRMAWSEKYKDKENRCFLECKAFGGTAQFMERNMNRKGQEIVAEGKLNTEEWTSQDGQKRSRIVLMIESVHFCGSRQDAPAAGQQTAAPQAATPTVVETDELPF